MAWDPAQYLRFADHRLRPATDLLARVDHEAPSSILDLGCGAGNVTRLLAERWPKAALTGVDSSPQMLAKARDTLPGATWIEADIANWRPDAPADIVFSNALLQWLDGHDRLIPALCRMVAPGGTLAIQMPLNAAAPSHTGLAEAAKAGPWRAVLEPLLRETPVAGPDYYWDLIVRAGGQADVWESIYLHPLEGEDAVVEWVKGTALKPLLDALTPPWRDDFLKDYKARMRAAYPRRADGVTLFPFRRLFLVARF